MKFILLIVISVATLAAAIDRSEREQTEKYRLECGQELNIPVDELDNYNKSEIPKGRLGHCYVKCFLGKLGVFDEKDGFKVEVILKKFLDSPHPPHGQALADLRVKLESCAKAADLEENACERAYRGVTCLKSQL